MITHNEKPNILIFMTDQQQLQVTMPGHPCKTPHLDKFSAEGIRSPDEQYIRLGI